MLEYAKKPPLFPWESELCEYPTEADLASADSAMSTDEAIALWKQHLSSLDVPKLLPESVLSALIRQCQNIIRPPAQRGIQLVRVVEPFFPVQNSTLESIANIVLAPVYRSDNETKAAVLEQITKLANDYDSASVEQQIALLMIAAQEMLEAMTLSLSKQKPEDTREWITAHGMMRLSTKYIATAKNRLTITAMLPKAGHLRLLCNGSVEKQTFCSQPDLLALSWHIPNFEKTYLLEVFLDTEDTEKTTLNFVVRLESSDDEELPGPMSFSS
ncbi:hypothetical protein S7335_1480 [Synechococcus sp. PCC 7335]|nr:hypothetical protein S7335_1480 [Synechococcus sp. PCC 7335]